MAATEPAPDNRRLRAAREGMRARQKLATSTALAGTFLVAASFRFAEVQPSLRAVAGSIGVLLGIGGLVPFLLSTCPQCNSRYHGIRSLVRSADDPLPCRACGFQVNRHISRYG